MSKPIYHLLIPKQYRVWCVPNRVPGGEMAVTSVPSRATCANCLTAFRRSTTGRKSRFRVTHTGRELEPDPFVEWKTEQQDDL